MTFGSNACGGASADASSSGSEDGALRQLQQGTDVDLTIPLGDNGAADLPADTNPPEALLSVKLWSVHYVELRAPANPDNPDPQDPFNGFFLIAKNAAGAPLFFDTIASMDDGIAHIYFSTQTDADGNYLEIPLVAAAEDADAAVRVEAATDWLQSERVRIGAVIKDHYLAPASTTRSANISPQNLATWNEGIHCVASLANFCFVEAPPVYFVTQAAIDGTFALVDAVSGTGQPASDALLAGLSLGLGKTAVGGGIVRAMGTVGTKVISATPGGLKTIGMVGAVGIALYERGNVKKALGDVLKTALPVSCVDTYKNLTQVPRDDISPAKKE
jgi:hypothetical protein